MYKDQAEVTIVCHTRQQTRPLLSCLTCKHWPCRESDQWFETLRGSAFVNEIFTGFEARRTKMWLFKKRDGSTCPAPSGFDPNNPDVKMLEGVEEVYPIKQVLVPRLKLVPKPAEEIKAIRESRSKDESNAKVNADEPAKKRRKKNGVS